MMHSVVVGNLQPHIVAKCCAVRFFVVFDDRNLFAASTCFCPCLRESDSEYSIWQASMFECTADSMLKFGMLK